MHAMRNSKPILLVEDDDIDVMIAKRVFGDLEVPNQLICLPDGKDALEFLRDRNNEKPCLIFLDLNMPRMNGWELLEIISIDDVLRDIPIVILTTSDIKDDYGRVETFRPSVIGYITKSPSYQHTVAVIRRQLEELDLIQLANAAK